MDLTLLILKYKRSLCLLYFKITVEEQGMEAGREFGG